MRIIHSFWSRPGGTFHWQTKRDFLYSQALSVSQANKVYGSIDLITDSFGAHLFSKIKLPYSRVEVALDNAPVKSVWWIWGKIIAYKMQTQPFIHIDGDVYLWDRLPAAIENGDLVAQSFETPTSGDCNFDFTYDKNRKVLENNLPYLPTFWKHCADRVAVNAGIFGGHDVDLIHRYAVEVEKLLHANGSGDGWANVCLEQQLAYCAARGSGKEFTVLFDHLPETQQTYTHVCGKKKNLEFLTRLAARVQKECPEQFELINRMYPRMPLQEIPADYVPNAGNATRGRCCS